MIRIFIYQMMIMMNQRFVSPVAEVAYQNFDVHGVTEMGLIRRMSIRKALFCIHLLKKIVQNVRVMGIRHAGAVAELEEGKKTVNK